MKTFCFISGLLIAWLFNMAGLPEDRTDARMDHRPP